MGGAALVHNRVMRTTTSSRTATAALVLAFAAGACGSGGPTQPPPPVTGSCMEQLSVPNEGWAHVPEGTAIAYRHNPPASGPHYPVWARWELFTTTLARGYWVHNVEHGGVVLLHRPDAPASVITALHDAYRSLPADPACGHTRALLTPDPLLDRQVAVVAADAVLRGDCVDAAAIRQFTSARRGRGPEDICAPGPRP
jgi:hypothetical protein